MSKEELLRNNATRWFVITFQRERGYISNRFFPVVGIETKQRDVLGQYAAKYTSTTHKLLIK